MRQHAPPRDHRTQKLENIAAQIYRRLLPNDLDKQVQQRVPEQVAHHVSRFRREGTLPSVMLGFLFSLSSPANLLLPAFLDCDGDNDDDPIRPNSHSSRECMRHGQNQNWAISTSQNAQRSEHDNTT
jgi:hypothetical protein